MNHTLNATILDCETNGKPINYRAPMKAVNNWPRVTQLAWQKIDVSTGEVLSQQSHLILPDGWVIPKEQFFIENNMSTERCLAEGKPIAEVLELLIEDLNDSVALVAHNMGFDNNVVGAEMIRLRKTANRVLQKICTMVEGTHYCKLPTRGGGRGFKWPRLEELHQKLFNEGFGSAHDALADVSACARCFVELVRLGVIKLK